VLDGSERARAAAFLSPRDQQRFTVAHGALRILAGRELKTPSAVLTWTPGRYGKPEFAPPWSGLHTSLSHSGDMIAVAISTGRPVGVDIQHLVPGSFRRMRPGTSRRVPTLVHGRTGSRTCGPARRQSSRRPAAASGPI
jgi:phosphopantetheinyl transferase